MSLLVTGTIGIDTVETPDAKAEDVLGGSAAYFAAAASFFTPVRLVGVVGDDFPPAFLDVLKSRPIDTAGLEVRAGSKTFRWHGKYLKDMNERESLSTDLNVVAEASPRIPEEFADSRYVFLANTHPTVQREFLSQLEGPELVVCDTMDLWITEHRDELLKTIAAVGGVVLNDGEARMLTGHNDLIRAGRAVLDLGPQFVVIKKGQHGAMLVTPDCVVVMPVYPTADVKDPTGAGDSFAAGMMGYLAALDSSEADALPCGSRLNADTLKAALARGTCIASIAIEGFSLDALIAADKATLDDRLAAYRSMLMFE